MFMRVNVSERNVMHFTSFSSLLIFIHSESYVIMKYNFVGYISISTLYKYFIRCFNFILRRLSYVYLLNAI